MIHPDYEPDFAAVTGTTEEIRAAILNLTATAHRVAAAQYGRGNQAGIGHAKAMIAAADRLAAVAADVFRDVDRAACQIAETYPDASAAAVMLPGVVYLDAEAIGPGPVYVCRLCVDADADAADLLALDPSDADDDGAAEHMAAVESARCECGAVSVTREDFAAAYARGLAAAYDGK